MREIGIIFGFLLTVLLCIGAFFKGLKLLLKADGADQKIQGVVYEVGSVVLGYFAWYLQSML